jgi:hypothetical protein
MFQDLDEALRRLLDDAAAPDVVRDADVEFSPPDRTYAPSRPTLNLFLYDVKENRELRDPAPIETRMGDVVRRIRPPLRVDCTYLVTAWTGADVGRDARVVEEHRVLGWTLAWLSRFPAIPSTYLAGDLATQPIAPPLWVGQMDTGREAGEFWSALGTEPRPSFAVVATIAMDVLAPDDAPMVGTLIARYFPAGSPGSADEWVIIGGAVRDSSGNPVPGAWVRLEPTGATTVTDNAGRFVFQNVRRGFGYRLRAAAVGLAEIQGNVDVPAPSGNYNLTYP